MKSIQLLQVTLLYIYTYFAEIDFIQSLSCQCGYLVFPTSTAWMLHAHGTTVNCIWYFLLFISSNIFAIKIPRPMIPIKNKQKSDSIDVENKKRVFFTLKSTLIFMANYPAYDNERNIKNSVGNRIFKCWSSTKGNLYFRQTFVCVCPRPKKINEHIHFSIYFFETSQWLLHQQHIKSKVTWRYCDNIILFFIISRDCYRDMKILYLNIPTAVASCSLIMC